MDVAVPASEAWFDAALAKPSQSRHASVHGARLHYRCWSMERAELPVLLLLHGFRAHARWWDFIAPFFADQYRVIAPDFSGMGDSEARPAYDSGTFAADITGLLEVLGLREVTAVGHSYGGSRLLRACAAAPELFKHAVLVDSYVLFDGEAGPSLPRKLLGSRSYPDFASAYARYRLMPDQSNALPFLVDYIARHAMREAADGWRWKFDPDMPATGYREPDGAALLGAIDIPVDFIHGQHSAVVSAERAARTVAGLRRGRGPVTIPYGQHHLMLDQPLALVGTLRALLAERTINHRTSI
ncbi:MAG: alpha/beta hydrolase [Pseudomonadota bacterium]